MGRFLAVGLFLSFLVFVWGFDLFGKQERKLQIRKLENCKERRSWPMSWENFRINYKKDTKENIMNVNLVVKEEVSPQFAMSFSFLKCDSSGNPDSCEFLFKDQRIENCCKYVAMKDQSWSEFVGYFDKELKCPIRKDTYHLSNLIINSSSLNKFPVKDAVWKLNVGGYDKGQKISCINMEVKVITIKKGQNS